MTATAWFWVGTALGLLNIINAQTVILPHFEIASVKVSSGVGQYRITHGRKGSAQVTYTNVPLLSVILSAYKVRSFQIIAPAWLAERKFDIAAKGPIGSTSVELPSMMQDLLRQRFDLQLHHETRPYPGYRAIISKSGSKLHESGHAALDVNSEVVKLQPGELKSERLNNGMTRFVGRGLSMARIISTIVERELNTTVIDETHLDGIFDFVLDYRKDPRAPSVSSPQSGSEGAGDLGSDLVSALREQLGLKLLAQKLPLDFLIVDHINRVPSDN